MKRLLNRFFRKTDPICGMKQEDGKGIDDADTGKWFCSTNCKDQYKKQQKTKKKNGGSCCH